MMNDGCYLAYGVLRDALKSRTTVPVAWSWSRTAAELETRVGAEIRGISLVALSTAASDATGEVVPGISFAVQSLPVDGQTPRHSHAWWHVFVVQSGSGIVGFGDGREAIRMTRNDVVLIPAWCVHELRNDGAEPFVTLNLSNMPQQADLANFRTADGRQSSSCTDPIGKGRTHATGL
ncbi:cupin domain-containing protein [Bradyrhizobium sp.]|uniref:cupin domain-containing protein n=1 Tax=Bradyrhizobium sp. TaxID=376 RepID=UPI00391D32CD